MSTLVLLRHGESTWNLANRFTGWEDAPLSERGREEASEAGRMLLEAALAPSVLYTSLQVRAIETAERALREMGRSWIPVRRNWRLNERHYGALQGLNKKETAEKYGDEQVLVWRRSYDTPPPPMAADDERGEREDRRYAKLLPNQLPLTECLKDTIERVLPFWNEVMVPAIKAGKRIVVVAHGNSIRGLVKYLDDISDSDIVGLNIPNGIPLVYELDSQLKPLRSYYLGDAETATKAAAAAGSHGKTAQVCMHS